MAQYIARVAKNGYNATDPDLRNLNFYETKPTFKILKQMQIPAGHALSIPHGLNYVPNFLSFVEYNGELFRTGSNNYVDDCYVRVKADNTNITFDSNTLPKKLIFFSDVPNQLGYAELYNNENFVFKIKDDSSPQKVIMSSEYNHLKEAITAQTSLVCIHNNPGNSDGSMRSVVTNHFVDIPLTLGYTPIILLTCDQTYHYTDEGGDIGSSGGSIPFGSSERGEFYILPNGTPGYIPMGFIGTPGIVSYFIYVYYGIKADRLRINVDIRSNFIQGTDFFTGLYHDHFNEQRNFTFTYKVFYNDIDELYSYIQ